jgi:phenylacetate-CoA ligase
LISHAYENCPYYRQTWHDHGLHPKQIQSPVDLGRLPVIDRETIRKHRPQMRAPAMRLITKSTGGSSGVPLQFDLDLDSHDRRTAAWHRGYAWAGAAPGTRQLYLWGSAIAGQSLRAKLKDRLYQKLHRRRVLSCFESGDDLAGRFATELDRYRPDVVVAYTNPLYEAARQLDETGRTTSHQPAAIIVGAEKLHSFQRELIERVFRAKVFETYGSREFMLIGSECEQHHGLHLTAENLLVEVLDEDGQPAADGTEGNVVITDLYNYGMPFIRYANGDRAIAGFGDCECGRGLPLLKKVVGRQLDMLIGSGGRKIPGEFFPHLVKDFPAVSRFQVVQDQPNRLRFAMVANGMADGDRTVLEQLVRRAVGDEVQVEFAAVSQIPLTAAGKLQVVVNRIPLKRAG